MTDQYRALRLERFAQTFREAADIVTLPFNPPGPGEIAVRNRWCGINGLFDQQIARNAMEFFNIKPPILTGVEAAGVVVAVGEGVTEFKAGDAACTLRFPGGYREANVGPVGQFAKLPEASREYLTLASTGVSALVLLEQTAEVKEGDVVAISAAAGGLGHIIVQLLKLRGCHVVAVAGGTRKADFVRSLGADRVIDYRSESIAEVLAREYPSKLNVAIDTVGGEVFDAFVDNVATHGRVIISGFAQDSNGNSEMVTGPRISEKIYYKAASVRAFMNGMMSDYWPAAREKLFGLYQEGKLKITFDDHVFESLPAIHDAVELLLSGKSMGKVVVNLAPDQL